MAQRLYWWFWEHLRDGWYLPWWQWRSLGLSGTSLWHWCCNNDCGHSYIVFKAMTTLLPSIKLILVPQSSPLRCIDNSLHHPEFACQTADGSYKLVGIVNWGGGYCGEVQSHRQHCFLRKQLRSVFSREFAKSNPTTYSFLCLGREAGSVHTRAILWPMDPGDDGRFGRCSSCVRFVLPFVHIITIQLASQTAKPVFVPFSPWVWNYLYLNWALILYRIHFTLHTVIYLCFSSLHCFFPNVFTSYHLAVIENEAFFIWLSIMNNLHFK